MHSDQDVRAAKKRLRGTINYIKAFENCNECRAYIEKTSTDQLLLLVTSGRCGQEVVPFVHDLLQVFSIYVYCMNRQLHETWAKKYKKV